MKAIDQYEGVVEKERQQLEDLETREETQEAQDSFDDFKNRRTLTFNEAFDHISDAIDRVYKELTSTRRIPWRHRVPVARVGGGTVQSRGEVLGDAVDETFRDMEQLSGGEKTMAALALIFAIHSYRSSPFFVLDGGRGAGQDQRGEDGGVYPKQVARHRRGPGQACQSIVISLKDYFFDKADSLVG